MESSEAHNCGNLRLRNVRLVLGRHRHILGKASQSASQPASYSAIQIDCSDTVSDTVAPPFTLGLHTHTHTHIFCRRYNANAAKRPKQPPKQTGLSSLCRRRRSRLGCRSSYSHLTNRNNKNKKTMTTATATETFGFGRGHNC